MSQELRAEILALVRRLVDERETAPFVPGRSKVPYAGRVYDAAEVEALVASALDFTLTLGREGARFEASLKKLLGVRRALYCHAGSAANLLAVATLCSSSRARPLRPGDEVITSALAFPTTVTPLLRFGLRPVFVDVDPATLNPGVEAILAAASPRTRAIVLAHTLGNPFDAAALGEHCRTFGWDLMEDCCDALGSKLHGRLVGTFGQLATLSFYPAHHITTGEGGALLVNEAELSSIAASIRDWGRGCYCAWDEPDPNGKCGKRFAHDVGGVAYDHRYTYVEQGFNLKGTDLGAAIGNVQLLKLPAFEARRKENFAFLRDRLARHAQHLQLPEALPGAEPSWFALPITVRDGAPFGRPALVEHLTASGIETRPLFSGNILRHEAFRDIDCRVVGELTACDRVLRQAFFVGVYPGLTDAMREHVAATFDAFLERF